MTSYGVDDAKAGSVLFLNRSREMYRALNESDLKADWCQQFLDKNGIRIPTATSTATALHTFPTSRSRLLRISRA